MRQFGSGWQVDWVRTRAEYLDGLAGSPDLVLADYNIPGFGALAALEELGRRCPDTPLIVITGCLGDEAAAGCIKAGACDYLLKDRLGRLEAAILGALQGRRLRIDARAAEERLRHSQKMEAIGQLAGGVAHEFNNVLTGIRGWIELLLHDEKLSDRATMVLQEISSAGALGEAFRNPVRNRIQRAL